MRKLLIARGTIILVAITIPDPFDEAQADKADYTNI